MEAKLVVMFGLGLMVGLIIAAIHYSRPQCEHKWKEVKRVEGTYREPDRYEDMDGNTLNGHWVTYFCTECEITRRVFEETPRVGTMKPLPPKPSTDFNYKPGVNCPDYEAITMSAHCTSAK